MRSLISTMLTVAIAALAFSFPLLAATPVHKCVVNGTATFQRDPCPSGQIKPPPTAEQLNRDQKKRNESAGAINAIRSQQSAPAAAVQLPIAAVADPALTTRRTDERRISTAAPSQSSAKLSCDTRKYCSQMTSCTEAKYFLANCPGVKLDGDADGIPCEEQWCKP